MTLDDILRDLHALRDDLMVFERKYNTPTEVFFEPTVRAKSLPMRPGYWIGAIGLQHTSCYKSGWPSTAMA